MFGLSISGIVESFIYGLISIFAAGAIFESGKRYVKAGWSNEFNGKLGAVPFFFATVLMGHFVKNADGFLGTPIEDFITMVPKIPLIGGVIIVGMLAFNYHVPNFNYLDRKSLLVYLVGLILVLYPKYAHLIPS